ncbi:unnamed protein product, partial [Ectocarpus sp. 12 AP-2014]
EAVAVGGGDCADRGGEFREGGGGGDGGGGSTAGGGGGGGTPVLRRSCLLTPAQVGCVLPALAELYGSPLWRVRAAVAEALPSLVSSTLCNLLRDEVLHLSRRMLFDRVDAVRRSAAEQVIMAARIDLDRCPLRLFHHVPGACPGQDGGLPSLSSSPSAAVAAVTTAGAAPDAEAGSAESPVVPLKGEGESPPLATGG